MRHSARRIAILAGAALAAPSGCLAGNGARTCRSRRQPGAAGDRARLGWASGCAGPPVAGVDRRRSSARSRHVCWRPIRKRMSVIFGSGSCGCSAGDLPKAALSSRWRARRRSTGWAQISMPRLRGRKSEGRIRELRNGRFNLGDHSRALIILVAKRRCQSNGRFVSAWRNTPLRRHSSREGAPLGDVGIHLIGV